MIYYFKIIRPINLGLLVLCFSSIKFVFFEKFPVSFALNNTAYLFLIFAVLLIAAAGYVINDIHDIVVDTLNKPNKVIVGKHIPEKHAFTFYIILNVLGVVSGFIVANFIEKPSLSTIFIIVSGALYWYATSAKNIVFLGNLLISVLIGFCLILPILFDIFPILSGSIDPYYESISQALLYIAAIAVYLNLMREIVKDIEDINGDKNGNRNTLPMVLGISRTRNLVFAMGIFALFMLLFFCYFKLYDQQLLLAYFIFIIGGPLLVFCIKSWNASKPKEFSRLSTILKIVMLAGIISIALIHKLYL